MKQCRVQSWWIEVVEMTTVVAKRRYSVDWRLGVFVDIAVQMELL